MTNPIPLPADTAIPSEDDELAEPELMEHEYDGIREYDNPLPGWWRSIFLGSIVFAGFYALYYHVIGWGPSAEETYRESLAAYQVQAAANASNGPTASEEVLTAGALDGATMSRGKGVFAAKCAGCHGEDARGVIGPNLTDDFQLHGATREDIFATIRDGVPTTAMPAWGAQLPGPDLVSVAVYVTTLRGTNVANGKAPQGAKVAPFH